MRCDVVIASGCYYLGGALKKKRPIFMTKSVDIAVVDIMVRFIGIIEIVCCCGFHGQEMEIMIFLMVD